MKQRYLFCLLLVCVFSGFTSQANANKITDKADKQTSTITVEHAYIRATIPGTIHSSAYMSIENKGNEIVMLLSASSDVSERIEIHQHSMVNGMMRMRKVESIIIEPKERVTLQPSGLHLMIFDVKKPLKSQQEVEITLNFSNNESVTMPMPVYNPVQERAAQKKVLTMHKHHH